MARKPKPFPYVKLRQRADGTIRPRFEPGPRERALGFSAEDLKHPDGRWFTLDETAAWARDRLAAVKAARAGAPRPTAAGVPTVRGRTIADLLDAYMASPRFKRLAPRSQRDYRGKADAILWQPRTWDDKRNGVPQAPELFAGAPVAAITPATVSAFFEHMTERRGLPMAAGAIRVLSAAFSWARLSPDWERHVPTVNPCKELGMPTPPPRLVIWTVAELQATIAAADAAGAPSIGDAIMIALLSGQRQGDVLSLVDEAGARSIAERTAAGEPFAVRQGKTGALVSIFATPELVARLAAAEARRKARVGETPIVMREATGEAWNEHAFRKAFAAARASAGVDGKRYQDLRDTAVTWLARAGCTIPEICAITGHSLQSATQILKHYLELGEPLAREAIRKLVTWMEREGVEL